MAASVCIPMLIADGGIIIMPPVAPIDPLDGMVFCLETILADSIEFDVVRDECLGEVLF